MFYKFIEEFSDIIDNYSVFEYKRHGSAVSLIAEINFKKGSSLFIIDYLFLDGKRKYSYHWQGIHGNLIARWDNSPHHREISSFPHHKHTPNIIVESKERNLKDILKFLAQLRRNQFFFMKRGDCFGKDPRNDTYYAL